MNHNFDTELFLKENKACPAIYRSGVASYSDKVENTRCLESLRSKMIQDSVTKTLYNVICNISNGKRH